MTRWKEEIDGESCIHLARYLFLNGISSPMITDPVSVIEKVLKVLVTLCCS